MLSKAKKLAGLALMATIIGTLAPSSGASVVETFYQMPFNKTFSTHRSIVWNHFFQSDFA
jgi:hypothetical protein